MTYELSIAQIAEEDIHEAFIWYEDQQQGLGLRLEQEFGQAIDSIRSNPLKTQIRYREIRVFFLPTFPFGIHFEVNQNEILILAFFHTSRDTKTWNRLL